MKIHLSWVWAIAPAVVLGETCCPNGEYTDDPQLICNNPEIFNYGDLQCYGKYEIGCAKTLLFGQVVTGLNGDYFLNISQTLASCIRFCREYAPDFTGVNANGNDPRQIPLVGECDCYSNVSTFAAAGVFAYSAIYCPSGYETPRNRSLLYMY
jgi:hypothetical protein